MSVQATVTERDLRRLLELVGDAELAPADEEFPSSVLAGLHRIIPADDITFQLMRSRQRVTLEVGGLSVDPDGGVHDVNGGCDGVDDDIQTLFWSAFWEEGGCSQPQDTGDYTRVTRSEFSWRDGAHSPMDDLQRQLGTKHEVRVPLPPQDGLDRRLLLFRDEEPAFSDRELLLLTIFRPHLIELHDRQRRRRQGQPELTPRQWEILRQVSAGDSNRQVARSLGVSEATVRKHLEHIFMRLDVASRTAAVARVTPFLHVA